MGRVIILVMVVYAGVVFYFLGCAAAVVRLECAVGLCCVGMVVNS